MKQIVFLSITIILWECCSTRSSDGIQFANQKSDANTLEIPDIKYQILNATIDFKAQFLSASKKIELKDSLIIGTFVNRLVTEFIDEVDTIFTESDISSMKQQMHTETKGIDLKKIMNKRIIKDTSQRIEAGDIYFSLELSEPLISLDSNSSVLLFRATRNEHIEKWIYVLIRDANDKWNVIGIIPKSEYTIDNQL